MCGIAGALIPNDRDGRDLVSRMLRAQRHRGPDDEGLEQVAGGQREVWVGSCRLAILDLTPAGHMPMQDPDTGNWIVYNGEVYNFMEFRRELERQGSSFRSRTDTEVVLEAYARWGPECVERFRGMFAFAIWDHSKEELFLARDRLGKKPLYYFRAEDGTFLFASEVRALLASGLVGRQIEPAAVRAYLHNGFLVDPLTLVRGIYSLLPGHWMRVDRGGNIIATKRYWSIPAHASSFHQPSASFTERVRAALSTAVSIRLISDVPLGAFLSGGLDSSTIVALMARTANCVRTFTISFKEKAYDESPFAEWIAKRFGTEHTVLTPWSGGVRAVAR